MKLLRYHCPFCKSLLFKGSLEGKSVVEIKCRGRSCKRIVKFGRFEISVQAIEEKIFRLTQEERNGATIATPN